MLPKRDFCSHPTAPQGVTRAVALLYRACVREPLPLSLPNCSGVLVGFYFIYLFVYFKCHSRKILSFSKLGPESGLSFGQLQ